jgi:hypothetical protein
MGANIMDDNTPRPEWQETLRRLAEGQLTIHETTQTLSLSTQALVQLTGQLGQLTLESANRATANQRSNHGPKTKEPKPYDGDRTDGKLDDHIRDVRN